MLSSIRCQHYQASLTSLMSGDVAVTVLASSVTCVWGGGGGQCILIRIILIVWYSLSNAMRGWIESRMLGLLTVSLCDLVTRVCSVCSHLARRSVAVSSWRHPECHRTSQYFHHPLMHLQADAITWHLSGLRLALIVNSYLLQTRWMQYLYTGRSLVVDVYLCHLCYVCSCIRPVSTLNTKLWVVSRHESFMSTYVILAASPNEIGFANHVFEDSWWIDIKLMFWLSPSTTDVVIRNTLCRSWSSVHCPTRVGCVSSTCRQLWWHSTISGQLVTRNIAAFWLPLVYQQYCICLIYLLCLVYVMLHVHSCTRMYMHTYVHAYVYYTHTIIHTHTNIYDIHA